MIFLTVGTQFPFDRLVREVDGIFDEGLIGETLFAQIGESPYKPRNFESVSHLEKSEFENYVKQSSGIIGHAGMGTIIAALSNHKPLLAMPRLKRYREAVNDHQMAIAKKFEELGHILVAYDTEDLPRCIRQLKTFVPKERKANPDAVINRIRNFLNNLQTPTESSK
jgi:UDP-N-acetylglucosamine transferase subunit ALG13